jgi:predicted esterase
VDFPTGSDKRSFNLIVPPSYDGTSAWPVVFAWHWLNAGPGSFISAGELESATEQMHFIAVVPDHKRNEKGDKVYQFDWPFVETWGVPGELQFIDDMLACVSAQYKVDPTKIHGIGVSAGGLWVTYVSGTDRANHFASIESLSGGLGADPFAFWQMQFTPQPRKFPAIVLWGGPTDNLGIDFAAGSKRYRDALRKDHHFVVECTHDAGHAMPPVPVPPDGGTHFEMLWQFMLDHPYGTPPEQSPYKTTGLPSVFPSWCSIAP